ncbi:MAG: AraC family transcriptional regulator [Opitutales bacterium]
MRILGECALVVSVAGSCRFLDADGSQTNFPPGTARILLPEIGHAYGPPPGRCWHQWWLTFDGPVFRLWRDLGLLAALRNGCALHQPAEAYATFREILAAAERPESTLTAVTRLQTLLAAWIPASPGPAPAGTGEMRAWLHLAREALAAVGPDESPLPAVARSTGLGYESFRKRFRAVTGETPGKFRERKRLEQACQLLLNTRHPQKEVAHRIGYSDPYHFSRRFKKLTGRTPGAFRRNPSHLRTA